jgi:uncharacterized membrane protein YfcA
LALRRVFARQPRNHYQERMILPLSSAQLAASCLVVAVGALVQGSVGFGMGLIAAPVLLLIDPMLVPGPLLCCGLVLSTMIGIQDRRWSHREALQWAVTGLLGGAMIGATTLASAPPERLSLFLGCLVLLAVLLSVAGLHLAPRVSTVFFASTLAGFMGVTSSIPGPPLALVYQRAGGARLRGTLAPLFLLSGIISISALVLVGKFGGGEFRLGLALVPGVLVGFAVSRSTARWFDPARVRVAVLLISGASGVAVILRALM